MTFFFRDYSQYNPVVADPYPVRIARATIGLVKDTAYEANFAQAAKEGDFFVAYHFLNAHQLDDPIQQANFCYSVVGRNVPLMLDHEPNRGFCATMNDAWLFINAYRKLGGIVHADYLPHWVWQDYLGSPDLRSLQAAGIELVSSDYTAYSDTGPGWADYGNVTPVQWQFTSTPFDTNAFRGSVNEYERLIYPEAAVHHPVSVLESPMFIPLDSVGQGRSFTPPSCSAGVEYQLSLTADFGDAVVRVAVWSPGLKVYTFPVKRTDLDVSPLLFDLTTRKVTVSLDSVTPVSPTQPVAVGVTVNPTVVATK